LKKEKPKCPFCGKRDAISKHGTVISKRCRAHMECDFCGKSYGVTVNNPIKKDSQNGK